MTLPFLIGQRVIVGGSLGKVVMPEREDCPNTPSDIWVYVESRGFASRYSVSNIQPLPGGQL